MSLCGGRGVAVIELPVFGKRADGDLAHPPRSGPHRSLRGQLADRHCHLRTPANSIVSPARWTFCSKAPHCRVSTRVPSAARRVRRRNRLVNPERNRGCWHPVRGGKRRASGHLTRSREVPAASQAHCSRSDRHLVGTATAAGNYPGRSAACPKVDVRSATVWAKGKEGEESERHKARTSDNHC